MILAFVIALAATAGLGYQIGFQRGMRCAAQRAEEEAIVTTITRIMRNTPERCESPQRGTRGIYSLRE